MAISWAQNVNTNFYGLDGSPIENREEVKFKSGRVIYHKLNSAQKKTHSVKLRLDDVVKTSGMTEFERFLAWYDGDNGSGTAEVTLTDIEAKTGTKVYFVTLENWNGQAFKELSLTLQEC